MRSSLGTGGRVVAFLAFLVLASSPDALAKKCTLDLSTEEAKVRTAKCLKFFSNTAGLKKAGFPKKIAVGGFQIRFTLRTQEYGVVSPYWTSVQRHYLQWDDAVYRQLTEMMYDSFVEVVNDAGIEVAPLEDVMATSVYQRMEAESDPKKKDKFVRFTPYGMKNMKSQGMLQGQKHLPGINKELGTDAVVVVFMELSLCQMQKGKFFGKKERGAYLCFADTEGGMKFLRGHPFTVQFYGGYKEGKMPGGKILYSPKWQNEFHKTHDPPVHFDTKISHAERSWWTGLDKMEDADLAAFAKGAVGAFELFVELGLAQYKAKAN